MDMLPPRDPRDVSRFARTLSPKLSLRERIRSGEYRFLFFCMLIPVVLVYLIYLVRGQYPFGNGCVLVLDLNGQYVWFFEALRNFVKGDAELLYSFSRALGGEFLGIYAYYLASPLSYLVCLFPTDRMLEALLFLFLVKTALTGASFGFYLYKTMGEKNKLSIVLFSAFYALSAYALVQQHNTMWIDAVMYLPLVTLGIESVIKHGKFKLYTVSLALTLWSNYYIGYMVCFWCLIYFCLYYAAHPKAIKNPHGERLHLLRSLVRMAFYSLIAIGIAGLMILGAYYSLNFGKTTFSDPSWEFEFKFNFFDFLYKLLPGSYDTVRPEGLPFVSCGVLTLLLLPAYFLSKKYPIRQKIFSVILLAVLYFSFAINIVDLVWHGFQTPNWLNYRYSFMFCFYLCVLAARAFSDFERVSIKIMVGTSALLLVGVGCVVARTYFAEGQIKLTDLGYIALSLIFIISYSIFLRFWRRTDQKILARNLLCGVVCVELFASGLINICFLDMDVGYSRYNIYNDFLDRTRPIVNMVQESDDSFYRMEKTFFRKTNDNMALGIRGLSGSTSTLNKETIKLLEKMGYSSRSHWSKYLGGNPVSDSLLGLKYIITDQDIYENYYEFYKKDFKNGYTAYKNPYALSIAYGVDDSVLSFPIGFYTDESRQEEETAQKSSSAISEAVNALKNTLNDLLGIEENKDPDYLDTYNSPFERLNAMVTAMLGESETVEIFVPISISKKQITASGLVKGSYEGGETGYKCVDENNPGTLSMSLTMPITGELFFYMPTNYPREVSLSLSLNHEDSVAYGTFNGNETQRIISLGALSAGDSLELDLTLMKDAFYFLTAEEYFYYIDWAVFENAMSRLSEHQLILADYTESSFEGTFTASSDNQLLMTTIAYDNGWEIYVDGERVPHEKAFGGFLSFHVGGSAGQTHTIQMVYRPRAITVGLIISLTSFGILILLFVLDRFFRFGCKDRLPTAPAFEEHDSVMIGVSFVDQAQNASFSSDQTNSTTERTP